MDVLTSMRTLFCKKNRKDNSNQGVSRVSLCTIWSLQGSLRLF
jgi:hypothetical protein